MQRLCTPGRKVYQIEHEDEAQLRSIKQRYNLTANVVHNLRQLLGWRAVGTPKGGANDRVKRLERGGGQLPDPLQCRQARLGCYRPVAQARRRYSRQAARRWTHPGSTHVILCVRVRVQMVQARKNLEHKIDAQRQRDERQQPLHSQARAGWRREFYGKAPTHGTLDGLRERNLSRERPTRASCILFWYVSVRN